MVSRHGTRSRYQNGCRCAGCTDANRRQHVGKPAPSVVPVGRIPDRRVLAVMEVLAPFVEPSRVQGLARRVLTVADGEGAA